MLIVVIRNILRNRVPNTRPRNRTVLLIPNSTIPALSACRKENMSDNKTHIFSGDETKKLRELIIQWYEKNKRDLPWRRKATIEDLNQRAYSVWVSEIMLQQTQVKTVEAYYNRWMSEWPTLQDLANATLEEVNTMWSGLGYYSRGRRLHEAAKKVVDEYNGDMPRTAAELLKNLPGVGRYTAGAIASIAYEEPTGLVDGNVIRVFSRMRIIGSDTTAQHTVDSIWSIANATVDSQKPGAYNQGLMELGATVCTPKTPSCNTCPVSSLCKAYMQVEEFKKQNASKLGQKRASASFVPDIECADGCKLCLPSDEPWDSTVGVQNYPRKGKKKAPRKENTAVCIIQAPRAGDEAEYLMVQRPATGLLANLWEFPSVVVDVDSPQEKCLSAMKDNLSEEFCLGDIELEKWKKIGNVVHVFSHIHQTYRVSTATVAPGVDIDTSSCSRCTKWVTKEELNSSAISTAMKKVFKNFDDVVQGKFKLTKGEKRKSEEPSVKDGKKQLSLSSFFKPKNKI